jgi:integrase
MGLDAILKSIRKTDLDGDDAMRIVNALKVRGLIDIAAVRAAGQGAVPFVRFLGEFWDYDTSPYIRDSLSHGYRFSRHYAHECLKRLKAYIAPFFNDKKLNGVTTEDLKKLSNRLADRGLATSTINQTMLTAVTPLKWACKQKIIPENPAGGLTRFSIVNRERGILTEAEAAAVFGVQWEDRRAFTASLVAATTGARQGECLALRRSDIGEDTLSIGHNWNPVDGLKCPKNGHKRTAPLLPEVRAALLDLLRNNPHHAGDPFVFYSVREDRPVDGKILLDGLKDALDKAGVDYKARNIVFHSWRHYFVKRMTDVMEGEKIARVSGYLSEAVFKKYADHPETKNIREVGEAAAGVFGNILMFRKERTG